MATIVQRLADNYYIRVAQRAYRESLSWSISQAMSLLIGFIVAWLTLHYQLTPEAESVELYKTVLYGFVIALSLYVLWQIVRTPYILDQEAQARIAELDKGNATLRERLKPRIQISVYSDCVHIEPTQLVKSPGTPGPLSKWVQFQISCATEVLLHDCKAWLTSIKAIEGCRLGEELINESVRCVWSNYSLVKGLEEVAPVTVYPKVPLRACLFVVYEGENILQLTTVPIKARLNGGIQRRGFYRIEVAVTAENAPPESGVFIFDWTGFDHLTLLPKPAECRSHV
jgi:hypothetical protein